MTNPDRITIPEEEKDDAVREIERILEDETGEPPSAFRRNQDDTLIRSSGVSNEVGFSKTSGGYEVDMTFSSDQITNRIRSVISPGGSSSSDSRGSHQTGVDVSSGASTQDSEQKWKDEPGPSPPNPDTTGTKTRVEFTPPFDKADSDYNGPGDGPRVDEPGFRCKNCVHFMNNDAPDEPKASKTHACHVVQGPIDKNGYCDRYFSDIGVFARKVNKGRALINFVMWGEDFSWDKYTIDDFFDKVREKVMDRIF